MSDVIIFNLKPLMPCGKSANMNFDLGDTIWGVSLFFVWSANDAWDVFCGISFQQGAVSIRKTVLPGMAIPMLKIRRPNGRLIFNMEIAIRR